MCRKMLYLVSFILMLSFISSTSADELIASYEDDEMDDLTVSVNADAGLTVTRVLGGVDGAPVATDGEYILKWVWAGETDRKIEIRHDWDNRRLDLAPYNVITCDVWFDGPSALPATIGIWDDVFEWTGVVEVPIGTGQWYTVEMDISSANQNDLNHIFAFLFEDLAGDDGVIYTDNMRLIYREQVQAWRPIPFDKAISVDPNIDLTWSAGVRADSHNVYFGTSFEDVNNATMDTEGIYRGKQALDNTSYDPGTLEYLKTYYWRIDEVSESDSTVWKGEVWKFKTTPLEYVEIPLVSYEDSETNYEVWSSPGIAGPDSSLILGDKLLGGSTWEGVEVPAATDGSNVLGLSWINERDVEVEHGCTFENSNFRFDLVGIDEIAFDVYYTDGSPLPHIMGIFDWRFRPSFNASSNLPTATGQWFTIVIDVSHLNNTDMDSILDFMFQEHGEDFDPDLTDPDNWAAVVFMDNLRLRYPASRSASLPDPPDGAVDIDRSTDISWRAGIYAASHNVYLGTNYDDVNNADTSAPEFKGNQPLSDNSYNPPGDLEINTTYYWRIDEVNDAHPDIFWKGAVWSFTTANFFVVEDFENYSDYPPNEVWNTWLDGYDNPGNGSSAGYPDPDFVFGEHYLEDQIVHSGLWSMPLFYDNSVGLSEVTRTLNADWTEGDPVTLTLFYRGVMGNDPEPMFVAIDNAIVYNDDANAATVTEWIQWDIALQRFTDQGVNLGKVGQISIGFGNRNNPVAGGEGHVFFDDIRLYRQ
jgi:hypothetical protein